MSIKECFTVQKQQAHPAQKNLARKIAHVTFMDINNNFDVNNENVATLNNTNINGTPVPFTVDMRSISGLPTFAMTDVVDVQYMGWENVVPTNVASPSGNLQFKLLFTEDGQREIDLFNKFNRIHQSTAGLETNLISTNEEGELIFDSGAEAALMDKVVENMNGDLTNNEKVYFKVCVNMLEYLSKDIYMGYIFYGCWIKSIKMHDSSEAATATDIQYVDMEIRYDSAIPVKINKI